MTLNSMTGFARGAGLGAKHRWNWEIKSVNNKGLDVRVRQPAFLDGFDVEIKKKVAAALTRGSVFITLTVESDEEEGDLVINEDRLQSLFRIADKYKNQPGLAPATLDGLLAVKGVVDVSAGEVSEETLTELKKLLGESLITTLNDLKSARADEGQRMEEVLVGQVNEIERLAGEARTLSGDRVEAMQARFKSQLAKLENIDKPVAEDRIVQELAVLAVKADIQEELDRLDSHVSEANSLLAANKPVGRRLDFLCQEFNREANTLCSKSGDSNLTKIGLDLKVLIDQFREQIQNIE